MVVLVKMGQIHTDYTEIMCVCTLFGHLCSQLLLIAVNVQNAEVTHGDLPFSCEIGLPQNSRTRNMTQSQHHTKMAQTPIFLWYAVEVVKVGD